MIPREILCPNPECARRFLTDSNNNVFADCPVCGGIGSISRNPPQNLKSDSADDEMHRTWKPTVLIIVCGSLTSRCRDGPQGIILSVPAHIFYFLSCTKR